VNGNAPNQGDGGYLAGPNITMNVVAHQAQAPAQPRSSQVETARAPDRRDGRSHRARRCCL